MAKYKALRSAVSLGNTLPSLTVKLTICRIKLFYSINSINNLPYYGRKLEIGKIESRLSLQRFIEFGYFGVHFSVTCSKAAFVCLANKYYRLQRSKRRQ